MERHTWRILLIDDDQDDYFMVGEILAESRQDDFRLDWASSYKKGQEALETRRYDAVLVDYDLGVYKGTNLIRAAAASGYPAPLILLTGRGSYEVGLEAMECGASDYINKNEANPGYLERSIRFAIERQRLLEENRRQQNLLERIMIHSLSAIAVLQGPDHRYIMANPSYIDISRRGSLLGRTVAEVWPEVSSVVVPLLDQVYATGQPYRGVDMPFVLERENGPETTYLTFTYAPFYNSAGQIEGVLVTAEDTTWQVLSRRDLQVKEASLRSFFDSETILAAVVELRAGDIYTVEPNLKLATALNRTPEEMVGKSMRELGFSEEDVHTWFERFQAIARSGRPASNEYPIRLAGQLGWFYASISPILPDAGRAAADSRAAVYSRADQFVFVAVDITERKRAEEEIRAKELLFRGVFENAAMGIALVGLDGRFLRVNPPLCEILGYSDEELLQKTFLEITYPDDLDIDLAHAERLRDGIIRRYSMEKRYIHKDGSLVWANLTGSAQIDLNGRVVNFIAFIEDITMRKNIEASLHNLEAEQIERSAQVEVQRRLIQQREMERMEIARDLHDGLLQELTAISIGIAEAVAIPERETRIGKLQAVRELVQKQSHEIRAFCHDLRPPTLVPFGLEKAIRSHVETFRERYPGLAVHLNLHPDRQLLPEDKRMALFRIYQEVMNNAARHARAGDVWISLDVDEDEVCLQVEDNGVGYEVPTDWVNQARTGHLGLVGVRERAQAIDAQVDFDSKPGHGARVQVTVKLAS